MRTYHNDQAIKDKYIARFAEHRRLDQVIQGLGFEDGRGCFIGCTLDNYDHKQFSMELGWPIWLAHLADVIFECLPVKDAPQFGTDLLDAVPVGIDLDPIEWKLAIWRHTQQLDTLKDINQDYAKKCISAIEQVIALCEKNVESKVTEEANREAYRAAQSAEHLARSVAHSAARSVELVANSARWSAATMSRTQSSRPSLSALAAASAVSSVVNPEFSSFRTEAYFSQERDMLLKLIKETK